MGQKEGKTSNKILQSDLVHGIHYSHLAIRTYTKLIIYLKMSENHFSYHIFQTHKYDIKMYFNEYSDLY